jgi:hypothetical protein
MDREKIEVTIKSTGEKQLIWADRFNPDNHEKIEAKEVKKTKPRATNQ